MVQAVAAAAEPFPDLNWVLHRPLRNVRAVFCHVTDPAVAFLSTSDELYRTDDEGKTWKAVESASAEKIGVVTTLAVSPADEKRLVVGTDDNGLHLSADGGATWKKLGGEGGKPAGEHVEYADFDPSDPSWRTIMATHGTAAPGISITRDLGATFSTVGTDRFLRKFVRRRSTLIAVGSMARTEGREWGLHRSGSDGLRWEECNRGLRPTDPIATTSGWRFYCATLDGEILTSDDDGRTWRAAARTEGANWVSFFWTLGRTAADEIYAAYDPYSDGLVLSNRRFAPGSTVKRNEGLYVGSFVRSGASAAANANGSVYYIVMSNALWVGRRVLDKAGPDIAQAWCTPGTVWVDEATVNASQGRLHQRIERIASSGVRPADVKVIAAAHESIATHTAGMRFRVSARVSHPKGPGAITSVAAGAAVLGGPASVPLFDDGKHGDEKPGDGIWSGELTFSPTMFDGETYRRALRANHTTALTVTATDAGGAKASWSAAVSLQGRPGTIVIYAGGSPGLSSTWGEGPVSVGNVRDEGLTPRTAALAFQASGPGPWRGSGLTQGFRSAPTDISGRQTISFHIKGTTDQDVYVQIIDRHTIGNDVFDEPHHSQAVWLIADGYLKNITPSYQKVTIPLSKLLPPGTLFLREFGAGVAVGVGEGGKPGSYYVDQIRFDP